jgi:nicotinamide-nucleotide amidase
VRVELVTIGTELLLGQTVDTNAAWIGRALAEQGIRLTRRTTVSDDGGQIQDALRDALRRADAVLTTGGLGPTRDDITKQAVAAVLGRRLVFDPAIWDDLVARYARLRRPLSEANRPQADVPEGATVLPNPRGTAPGLWLEGPFGVVVLLPGVPGEMRGLMTEAVLPRLAERVPGAPVIRSRTLRTAGIPESNLSARLGTIDEDLAPLSLAYLPDLTGVDLRLTAWELPAPEASRALTDGIARLRERAGHHAYGEDDADLAAVVLDAMRVRGWTLAVAESCTGGLLAGRLTAVPGSSAAFVGGLVTYADDAKSRLAGVPEALLRTDGAVSESVALALADGAARNFSTLAAVGITGIAGPTGGSEAKPVGTVWFGFVAGDRRWSERVAFPGNRSEIRARAVQFALFTLWRVLSE